MATIVQRARNITVEGAHMGDGIVVFLSQNESQLKCVVSKVLKIRLWDRWKVNVADLKYTILCILPHSQSYEKLEMVQAAFTDAYDCGKVHTTSSRSSVSFINCGPCTLVLEV